MSVSAVMAMAMAMARSWKRYAEENTPGEVPEWMNERGSSMETWSVSARTRQSWLEMRGEDKRVQTARRCGDVGGAVVVFVFVGLGDGVSFGGWRAPGWGHGGEVARNAELVGPGVGAEDFEREGSLHA
jgi:hypothetical protein